MPLSPPLDGLAGRVQELRVLLKDADPFALAKRTGCNYLQPEKATSGAAGGEFELELWSKAVRITFPDLIATDQQNEQELPTYLQALILYYLSTCDGTPQSGEWVAFSELPDGRFYAQAFQGYTGKPLCQAFGSDMEAFGRAAEKLGGKRAYLFGDMAFAFQALPRVALLAIYWAGDEDFPSTCQVLFDSAASHHLPTDACAILGSQLTQQLIKVGSA